MAGELENKLISKTNTGFPDYLDFNRLRTEAIHHIGKLSGKVWTDHNVHDPGITILETLIYAILDLGYRTNLPPADLFASDPENKDPDNNFFLPSRILANNPLTITDFRKLLVDIRGVKNAWLEVDEEMAVDFCDDEIKQRDRYEKQQKDKRQPCECDRVNGLYHVYIQLEDSIDPASTVGDAIISKIKRVLFAHRNLCEDYLDIKVLCRLEIGLCADIELEPGIDVDEAYRVITASLGEFFSPSPRFYTFQELLDKGRTVDEIYAGRPFDITESHGFVDTQEFEEMRLRRMIHLSDVYNLLFSLKGVSSIRNLGWITCCEDKDRKSNSSWQLHLPEHHIPIFSEVCSGFRFYQTGIPVKRTITNGLANNLGLRLRPKGVYKLPSPYLEPEYPRGTYRKDLADYFSIQNDFPKVYGISEGGLANDVSVKRKSQARQLQGFLLFFDQLLANYLVQLKNIRSLFSLTSSSDKKSNHTYFTNQLKDVPYFKELVRFSTEEGITGKEGNILAYPTPRKNLQTVIESDKLKFHGVGKNCDDPCNDDFPEYRYCFATERDQGAVQLRHDLQYGEFEPVIVSNTENCYFFYLFTSSMDFAVISRNFYGSEQEAKNAATSFRYIGSSERNIRRYVVKGKRHRDERFSFSIELNLATYASYLQELVEDDELYRSRRQNFLDHLLARFAEKFAIYGLLSSGHFSASDISTRKIKAVEKFLSSYDDISSNRGKAYDYTKDISKIKNTSGFEKRFKALAGIDNWDRHYLCNFVVEAADQEYRILIELFNEAFEVPDKLFSKAGALASLQAAYSKLLDKPVFETEAKRDGSGWQIFFRDGVNNKYVLRREAVSMDEASAIRKKLDAFYNLKPDRQENVHVGTEIFKVVVADHAGTPLAESKEKFDNREKAIAFSDRIVPKVSGHLKDEKEFTWFQKKNAPEKLVLRSKHSGRSEFIDVTGFNYKEVDVHHLKTVKKRFSMINREATIQFDSLINHDTSKHAKEEFQQLLLLLHDEDNYKVEKDLDEKVYKLYVSDGTKKRAVFLDTFQGEAEGLAKAVELFSGVRSQTYRTTISDPIADTWEFIFKATDLEGNELKFKSDASFKNEEKAWVAAREFHRQIEFTNVKSTKEGMRIELNKKAGGMQVVASLGDLDEEKKAALQRELETRIKTVGALKEVDKESLEGRLEQFRVNKNEEYIFKLVDKNNLRALVTRSAWKKFNDDPILLKAELVKLAENGFNYIDIYLAGEIFTERKEPASKARRYHYQVKCTNRFYQAGPLAGKELILFESIMGYQDREEAQKGFEKDLHLLLQKAMDPANYGLDEVISTEIELDYVLDSCNTRKSIVFIPKETMDHFGGYEVHRGIIPLVKSYPIRLIGKDRYIFVAANIDEAKSETQVYWRSTKSFIDSTEAMHEFQFFLVLIKFKGNYYLDKSPGAIRPHLYLREVLAVSAHGYPTAAAAWGTEGIWKFICVAQAKNGFHNYWNWKQCNYSFYTACGNTGLVHPCSYESPKRRDAVMARLIAGSGFDFTSLLSIEDAQHILLHKYDKTVGAAISRINIVGPPLFDGNGKISYNNPDFCRWMLQLIEWAGDDTRYSPKVKGWQLVIKYTDPNDKKVKDHVLAESLEDDISKQQWKMQLLSALCYFPINKVDDRFYVEFRLPGADDCFSVGYSQEKDVCEDCEVSCYSSWKSECCFSTCVEAWRFYYYALALIRVRENYKPVYDCECGSYRVELHPQLNTEGKRMLAQSLKEVNDSSKRMLELASRSFGGVRQQETGSAPRGIKCLSEIVAINPQLYTNERMACEAVDRAKSLINSEGLHLVEHILLRPRCKDKDGKYLDCKCEGDPLPGPCIPDEDKVCHFKWSPGADAERCELEKTICFTPGCDPYSFIATVALPAWPARFRTKAGREIVEKALRREAPAHILLRILWLTPRDYCCFEYYFRQWSQWLALKDMSAPYSNCRFLELLFKKKFPELPECTECIPCEPLATVEPNCFENDRKPSKDCDVMNIEATVSRQVNELFCWSRDSWPDAEEEKYRACGEMEERVFERSLMPEQKKDKDEAVKMDANRKGTKEYAKEKASVVRGRAKRYADHVGMILAAYGQNHVAREAGTFLTNTEAKPEVYKELVHKILDEGPETSPDHLHDVAKEELIKNITWKYLDLACFSNKETVEEQDKEREKIVQLAEFFRSLRERKVDMQRVFDGWDEKQVARYESLPGGNSVRNILTGDQ
ncbi:MAG: hypothetical protein H7Y42_04145 [Chitinophagaceae bacterium]|nr:hypothetical protein [Chitinophagaceae bacterium]